MDKHKENHASGKGVVEITRYLTAGKTVKIIRIIRRQTGEEVPYVKPIITRRFQNWKPSYKKGCSK